VCVCVCVWVCARALEACGWERKFPRVACGPEKKETAALGVFFGSTAGPFFFSVSVARVSPWSLTKTLKSQCPKIK
jgi:hypothetical protein